MRLTIIGNGFDLHHGIPSSYSQFKSYVKQTNPVLHNRFENYVSCDEYWNDFEEALASFDTDQAIDEASNFLVPYGAENWSDAYHHDYQYELGNIVSACSSELFNHFCMWIRSLEVLPPASASNSLVNIDRSSLFLTFNYTHTLSQIYNIPPNQILHIHGCTTSPDNEIILGHDWSPEEIGSLNDNINGEDADTRVHEGNEIVDSYFKDTFKPTTDIIEKNKVYFNSLSHITSIDVMGHSLSSVDIPYFEEITSKIDKKNVLWRISYYDNEALLKSINTMEQLGVPCGSISYVPISKF